VADFNNNRVLRYDTAASKSNGADADGVLGQADFTSNGSVAASANTLKHPAGVMADSSGRLWVADNDNNRVLRYDAAGSKSNGADADGVLGQADFTSASANRGGSVAANTLYRPVGVVIDAYGRLWVGDMNNNRVLYFDVAAGKANGADANGVVGQANFAGNSSNRGGTPNSNTLNQPYGITVDTAGRLWVADHNNNRVLAYPALTLPSVNDALLVLGHSDFITSDFIDPITNNNFESPTSVAVDPTTGKVFVADQFAHRVLRFASFSALGNGNAAEVVLGQTDFNGDLINRGGSVAANTMFSPLGVAVDASGRLWVADTLNNRLLRFDGASTKTNGAAADGVFGQADFTSKNANRGGSVAANTLNLPSGVAVDASGRLWVADSSNNRLLRFDGAANKGNGEPADGVLGQANFTSGAANRGGGAAANTLSSPFRVAVDASERLWVADSSNNRLLRFDEAVNKGNGDPADGVLGQANFTSGAANRGGSAAANTLSSPCGVAVDVSGRLWVADTNNNRVLRFDYAADKYYGAEADGVLGQASFTSDTSGTGSNKLWIPSSVAVDASRRLWVVDTGNTRVLAFGSFRSVFLPTLFKFNWNP
jgi:sugar lactone lactonase YvrE